MRVAEPLQFGVEEVVSGESGYRWWIKAYEIGKCSRGCGVDQDRPGSSALGWGIGGGPSGPESAGGSGP